MWTTVDSRLDNPPIMTRESISVTTIRSRGIRIPEPNVPRPNTRTGNGWTISEQRAFKRDYGVESTTARRSDTRPTMWTRSVVAAALSALVAVPRVSALGQKQCLVFPDGGGHRHRTSQDQVDQVVFGVKTEMGEKDMVNRNLQDGDFVIATSKHGHGHVHGHKHDHAHGHAVPILTSSKHPANIHLAVQALAGDVEKVTGVRPEVYNDTLPHKVEEAVVVGVVNDGFLGGGEDNVEAGMEYIGEMEGLWEAFDVRVVEGYKGLKRALVAAGSNKVRRSI